MGFLDLFKKRESADDLRNKGVTLYEEKKYKQAAACFTKAMGMGDVGAETMLGTMLIGGIGVSQDIGAGIVHIINAADKDYLPALMSMADFYANGMGVEKDGIRAFQLMKKAADTGYDEAQKGLGDFYAHGIGTDENPSTAAYWYHKAADQGNADAQYMLGLMYAAGIGFEPNLEKAVQLWETAAAQGHEDAIKNLTELAEDME